MKVISGEYTYVFTCVSYVKCACQLLMFSSSSCAPASAACQVAVCQRHTSRCVGRGRRTGSVQLLFAFPRVMFSFPFAAT